MHKRHTTRVRHDKRQRVLKVRVFSPRIFWFGVRHFLAQSAKALALLALLGTLGYGAWHGARRVFLENDDFRLQAIELKPNSALDERRLVDVAGIDLNSSLFKLDINQIEHRLMALPELTAARVERHLPGTLQVTVSVRTPVAWVVQGPPTEHAPRILADGTGMAYVCPDLQREQAKDLPVIVLNSSSPEAVPGKVVEAPEFRRCLRLINDALKADPQANSWIDSVAQPNAWSLLLTTRSQVHATFGLGEHPRQFADLLTAVSHAERQGYKLDSINLIPERNIPVTLSESSPPKAVPVTPSRQEAPAKTRHQSDLRSLLDRG